MKVLTDADRNAARATRHANRRAMIAATKDYKLVWLDEGYWLELAQKRGIRLPPMYAPATPTKLQSWARKLSKTPFVEYFGCSPQRLIALNPKTPLRAFVGQMLEP